MKKLLCLLLLIFSTQFFAQDNSSYLYDYGSSSYDLDNSRPFTDSYGNHYEHFDNLFKDKDSDGLSGYFDNNDTNSDFFRSTTKSNTYDNWNFETPSYDNNSFDNNSSYYDYNRSRTIYTGPRGGKYYINSNGNKTYVSEFFLLDNC